MKFDGIIAASAHYLAHFLIAIAIAILTKLQYNLKGNDFFEKICVQLDLLYKECMPPLFVKFYELAMCALKLEHFFSNFHQNCIHAKGIIS